MTVTADEIAPVLAVLEPPVADEPEGDQASGRVRDGAGHGCDTRAGEKGRRRADRAAT